MASRTAFIVPDPGHYLLAVLVPKVLSLPGVTHPTLQVLCPWFELPVPAELSRTGQTRKTVYHHSYAPPLPPRAAAMFGGRHNTVSAARQLCLMT